ncbi:MAG: FAD-binding oxidoreductase, partial [Alphaproteobacteria bacterium]
MKTHADALDRIKDVVGPKGWIDGADDMAPYLIEARGLYRGACAGVVRPGSTDEVARVVAICSEAGLGITPQSGNTGLVGGGVPTYPDGDGIVLSCERLNAIRDIDPLNRTITVEAGVILADVQTAALDAGALFPLSLAAEGSCRIGGNLATNAGGVQVLRYGNARDMVLGLEVVLADGRVWDGLRGLRKNNTGYDLKHLFIGSEGTLGVITAAVLKLFPKQTEREVAMCAATDPAAVMDLFARLGETLGDAMTAFEIINRFAVDSTVAHIPGVRDPFADAHAQYALIEVAGQSV